MPIIIDCELSLLSYSQRANKLSSFAQITIKDDSLLERIEKLYNLSGGPIHIITVCSNTQLITDYLAQYIPSTKLFTVHYVPRLSHKIISEMKSSPEIKHKKFVGEFPSQQGYWFIYNHTLPSPKKDWQYYASVLDKRLSLIGFFDNYPNGLFSEKKQTLSTQENSSFYSEKSSYDPNHFKRAGNLKKPIQSDTSQKRNSRSPVRDLIENKITSSSIHTASPLRN